MRVRLFKVGLEQAKVDEEGLAVLHRSGQRFLQSPQAYVELLQGVILGAKGDIDHLVDKILGGAKILEISRHASVAV